MNKAETFFHNASPRATTPIMNMNDGTKYAPISSTITHIIARFVFTDYQFHTSLGFAVRQEQFLPCKSTSMQEMYLFSLNDVPKGSVPHGHLSSPFLGGKYGGGCIHSLGCYFCSCPSSCSDTNGRKGEKSEGVEKRKKRDMTKEPDSGYTSFSFQNNKHVRQA